MKPLLAIFAHHGTEDALQRHWPFFERTGADIIGIGRLDTKVNWPTGTLTDVNVGLQSYVNGNNLPNRFLDTLELMLNFPHEDLILTEWDSIFLKPLPPNPDCDFEGTLFYNEDPNFECPHYFHPYWRFTRKSAQRFIDHGRELVKRGNIEHGQKDRFVGRVVMDLRFRWKANGCFSANTIDRPELQAEARKYIAEGGYFIHGVKTKEQLDSLCLT